MNALNGITNVYQERGLALRNGTHARSKNTPSAVLHDVAPRMVNGLDERRVLAMADFIETLEMVPHARTSKEKWAPGPVGIAGYLDKSLPCTRYMLDPSGAGSEGFGLVCHDEATKRGQEYYLTGWGIICWAWGTEHGMANVAQGKRANELQSVLTAYPVKERCVGHGYYMDQVKAKDVANALRYYVGCEDPVEAWKKVADEWHAHWGRDPKPVVAPAKPVQAPAPASQMTGKEQWKSLIAEERYGELAVLCDEKVAFFSEQLAIWTKRKAACAALMEG